ncbi:MAG: HAD family phosphatase [Bacteroidales bacterium]|jgi:HAD superfamily hydrolase (TIGR01509 family)|nr:HAD family phosphatase [Bacteroidales bacterium]
MTQITTILFDFDGVISDTEPQYDIYYSALNEKYHLNVPDLSSHARGVTMKDLLDKFFLDLSGEEKKKVIEEFEQFELTMDYPLVPGVKEWIQYLKDNRYKIGLVTSSDEPKMKVVLKKLVLEKDFETVITAQQVTKGKPDPMCYLLAAKNLHSSPSECMVFEDSLAGIAAGKNAEMKVVGVSTTYSPEELKQYVPDIIPDFSDLNRLKSLL